jgi:hypothetical protein
MHFMKHEAKVYLVIFLAISLGYLLSLERMSERTKHLDNASIHSTSDDEATHFFNPLYILK